MANLRHETWEAEFGEMLDRVNHELERRRKLGGTSADAGELDRRTHLLDEVGRKTINPLYDKAIQGNGGLLLAYEALSSILDYLKILEKPDGIIVPDEHSSSPKTE